MEHNLAEMDYTILEGDENLPPYAPNVPPKHATSPMAIRKQMRVLSVQPTVETGADAKAPHASEDAKNGVSATRKARGPAGVEAPAAMRASPAAGRKLISKPRAGQVLNMVRRPSFGKRASSFRRKNAGSGKEPTGAAP